MTLFARGTCAFLLLSAAAQAQPAQMDIEGLEFAAPDNWRYVVDNGSVEGLIITPASAGKMTVHLEIDSPITRREEGITPIKPKKTKVKLGTYDVAAKDCMVRLSIQGAKMTYARA